MFCPKCGASLEDGARFCPDCGSVIEAPAEETPTEPVYEEPVVTEAPAETPAPEAGYTPAAEPAKKSSFLDKLPVSPKILGICAGALVAVILLIVLLTSGGGASGAYTFTEPQLFATANDGTVYVVSQSGKVQTLELDGYLYTTINATSKVGAVNSDGELYWFDQNTNKKVTEDCAGYYTFSQDGSVLVYTQEGDEGYDLYIYKGGKSTKIASEVSTGNICISPNGSAIGFSTYDSDEGEYKGYIYDGKINELGKNKVPVAVTNGASLVYLEKDGSLYVQKKYNEDSRVKLADSASRVLFNIDLTEVLVYDGEKTVYSAKGGEKQTALKFSPTIVYPNSLLIEADSPSTGTVYGVKSFIGNYFYNRDDAKIVRLNKDMSTTAVAKSVSSYQYQVAKDGKTIIFMKDDQVKKVNGTAKEPESVKIVDEVEGFAATGDGKMIFYSQDGEVYAVKSSGGKGQKVSDEIEAGALYKDNTFLYSVDEVLYSSTGGKGQKLASFDDDISNIYTRGKIVFVQLEDGTYLYSTNAKTFKVLYEG